MPPLHPHFFYGLDLGRRQDPSALAILERRHDFTGRLDPVTREFETKLRFVLRHVEAFPLGTPYFEIVRRIRTLIQSAGPHKTLVVDASGVGAPIVEALQATRLNATLIPITITAAGHPHPDPHGGYLVPPPRSHLQFANPPGTRTLQNPARAPRPGCSAERAG